VQFEQAATLTHRQDAAVLQMLAAMESETGRFADAVATAETALNVARQQQNAELATALEANLARYRAQALGGAPR
jgi:hypothetical protein